jgi:hypothetical protein
MFDARFAVLGEPQAFQGVFTNLRIAECGFDLVSSALVLAAALRKRDERSVKIDVSC